MLMLAAACVVVIGVVRWFVERKVWFQPLFYLFKL
jgi:hypothetical protein